MNIENAKISFVGDKLKKRVVLIVLDGWGMGRPYEGNAISEANTPVFDELIAHYPSTVLRASGEAVGLGKNECGNCSIGHLNIGLGRVFDSEEQRIDKKIANGDLKRSGALMDAIGFVKENNSSIHLIGNISIDRDSSSLRHLDSLLAIIKKSKIDNVFVHMIVDREEVASGEFMEVVNSLQADIDKAGVGRIATMMEKSWAMNCDNDWRKINFVYDVLIGKTAKVYNSVAEAIERESPEKTAAEEGCCLRIFSKNGVAGIKEGDAVIFLDSEYYRTKQLVDSFAEKNFDKFPRKYIDNLFIVSLGDHEQNLPVEVVFPEEEIENTLGDCLAALGLKQARISDVEKFGYITFFMNGKKSKNMFEDQELTSSGDVYEYGENVKISSSEPAKKAIEMIGKEDYSFIAVNLGNADEIGLTNDFDQAKRAVEAIDECLGSIIKSVLDYGCVAILTADHGNVEYMLDMQTGQVNNERTMNPVPFIVVSKEHVGQNLGWTDGVGNDLSLVAPRGSLCDVAPTILSIMGIKKPEEMTGKSLI